MFYDDQRFVEYNLEASQAPTSISIKLKGSVIRRISQLDNPILEVATQNMTNTDDQTIVPEITMDLALFPNDFAYNQKINTNTEVNNVSQKPQIEKIPKFISAIPV